MIFTVSYFKDLTNCFKLIAKDLELVNNKLPIYIMSGDNDPVGNFGKGTTLLFTKLKKVGISDLTLKLYKDGRHEMLNEINKEEVFKNIEGLRNQVEKIFGFEVVNNYDWIKDINTLDFLRDYGKYINVNYMLDKDIIARRLDSGITFCEFAYTLLQGMDFVYLNEAKGVTLQVAGSDQWGNITSGIELIRKKLAKDAEAMTINLLLKSDGTKFGKSEGNAVWINDEKLSSYNYYQYFRNIGDKEVGKCLRIYTDLPMDEVYRLEQLQDKEINEAKKILAFEATKICRGVEEAKTAQQTAIETFEKGIAGGDLPTISATGSISVLDAFVELGFVSSKGEARRLIKQSGLKLNDKPITDENYILTTKDIENDKIKLSQGKKKHGLLIIQ